MRMKRIVQCGAIVIALTMLAGYVVYSQKGHNPGGQFTVEARSGPQKNGKPANASMVASGSKSLTYVVSVPSNSMVAFGSKSAPVFEPELTPVAAPRNPLPVAPTTKTNLPTAHFKP
jgi:hypothetical protein